MTSPDIVSCEKDSGKVSLMKQQLKIDMLKSEGVSINGGNPKSSILIGFSFPNHPASGVPPFQETPHVYVNVKKH